MIVAVVSAPVAKTSCSSLPGEVVAAGGHLLLLRGKGRGADRDHCADTATVPAATGEPHRDPRRRRVVPHQRHRGVEPRHHHVEVAIEVEVRERDALRDRVHVAHPPPLRHRTEGEVPVVAEHDAARGPARELPLLAVPRHARELVADAVEGVGVADVPPVPVHGEQVLVAVEVHVEERRRPGPVGRFHARELPHLGPRGVAARELQHVPHPLRAHLRPPHRLGQRRVRRDPRLTPGERRAQHVGGEDVHQAVAVHVAEVHRHAGVAGRARGRTTA